MTMKKMHDTAVEEIRRNIEVTANMIRRLNLSAQERNREIGKAIQYPAAYLAIKVIDTDEYDFWTAEIKERLSKA